MAVGLLDVQGDLMYRVLVQLKYRVKGADTAVVQGTGCW